LTCVVLSLLSWPGTSRPRSRFMTSQPVSESLSSPCHVVSEQQLSSMAGTVVTPRCLQAASTICVLLGSAASLAHALLWQDSMARANQASGAVAVAGSAELAAAALLALSLVLEAAAFQRRRRSVANANAAVEAKLHRQLPQVEPSRASYGSAEISQSRSAECQGIQAARGTATTAHLGLRQRPLAMSSEPSEQGASGSSSASSSSASSPRPAHPVPAVAGSEQLQRIPMVPRQLLLSLTCLALLMGGATGLANNVDAVHRLGIIPRTWGGLPGVVFGCFVHLNWRHCGWNALGVVLLGSFAFQAAFGRTSLEASSDGRNEGGRSNLFTFAGVSVFIALTSGFCVWCLARPALHAGASGVVWGYGGLLLALMLRRRDVPLGSLLMVLAVVVCYGSAALLTLGRRGIFVDQPISSILYEACTSRTTSVEEHTFGFLAGLASAVFFSFSEQAAQATERPSREHPGSHVARKPEGSSAAPM